MQRVEFGDGETIFLEGDPSNYCYQIVSGAVDIRLNARGANANRTAKTIATLPHGEVFGEMSILDPGPRSATAVAKGRTVCVAYTPDEIMNLLETDPQEAINYIRILIRRIRDANRTAAKTSRRA